MAISVVLLLIPYENCHAYSCREEHSISDLYEQSEAAFIGRVKQRLFYLSLRKNKYLVEVVSSRKGNVPEELVIWTWTKCGADFVVGEQFVIFSRLVDGKRWTDMNSSWQVHENSQAWTTEYLEYRPYD